MYSTIGLIPNSKHSGKLIGTHQKLDKAARRLFAQYISHRVYFPDIKDILAFEGARGPDGLKRKSPGVDEPMHFIQPENDDRKLITLILDHQYNLRTALKNSNFERASFEAAWMAHAITDGLTPAHHYPFQDAIAHLIPTEKDFVKIFNAPIKGIMRGETFFQAVQNNWLYWGTNGFMTKHIAFEYGCAITVSSMSYSAMLPRLTPVDFDKFDLEKTFYTSLHKIATLDMYDRFLHQGWTTNLAYETRDILIPEIVRAITFGWICSLPDPKNSLKLPLRLSFQPRTFHSRPFTPAKKPPIKTKSKPQTKI